MCPSANSVYFSGFVEVTRDKVNRGARYGVEPEIPSLYGPKPYSYVDRTLLITGVLPDMYFYLKWIASTERIVHRVGVAVGTCLNYQLSEAHLYVGDLAGVHSMEFRGILFSEVSNVLV